MRGGGRSWTFGIELSPDSTATFSHENFNKSEVDELQIDDWFLLERLDGDYWFLRIGGQHYTILPNKTLRLDEDE